MRLSEYISAVTEVICKHKADAEVGDALSEGHHLKRGAVSANYESVIAEIKAALGNNKNLLGIFEDSDKSDPKNLMEKRIKSVNLRRHMLAVRNSLRPEGQPVDPTAEPVGIHDSPEEIKIRILNDLTVALDVKNIGCVFGKTEKEEHDIAFGRKRKSSPPEAIADKRFRKALFSGADGDVGANGAKIADGVKHADGRNASATKDEGPAYGTPEYERKMEALMEKLRKEGKIL